MKKKTRMRSKKNVRKTKRIRGGAAAQESGTKRKQTNGNGEKARSNAMSKAPGERFSHTTKSYQTGHMSKMLNASKGEKTQFGKNALNYYKGQIETLNELINQKLQKLESDEKFLSEKGTAHTTLREEYETILGTKTNQELIEKLHKFDNEISKLVYDLSQFKRYRQRTD